MYCSTNIVRVSKPRIMRWAGSVARMGYRTDVYRALFGKSLLGKPRRKWKNYIKTDLQEVEWGHEMD